MSMQRKNKVFHQRMHFLQTFYEPISWPDLLTLNIWCYIQQWVVNSLLRFAATSHLLCSFGKHVQDSSVCCAHNMHNTPILLLQITGLPRLAARSGCRPSYLSSPNWRFSVLWGIPGYHFVLCHMLVSRVLRGVEEERSRCTNCQFK